METQFAVAINWFCWSTRLEFGDFHNELKSLSVMGGDARGLGRSICVSESRA